MDEEGQAATGDRVDAVRAVEVELLELSALGIILVALFDLGDFWRSWVKNYENDRPEFPVTIEVDEQRIKELPAHLERVQLGQVKPTQTAGIVSLTLIFEHYYQARSKLMGLGGMVKVIAPEALRLGIIDYAQQILDLYD